MSFPIRANANLHSQPTTLKAPFLEQFTDDWESRWKVSHAKKEGTEEEWTYNGKWAVEEPSVLRGIEGDKGLVLKDKAAHHAISSKFDKPFEVNVVIIYSLISLPKDLELLQS